jgi:hypothetical protein
MENQTFLLQPISDATPWQPRPNTAEGLKVALHRSFDDALVHVDRLLWLARDGTDSAEQRRFRLLRTQLWQWQELTLAGEAPIPVLTP